MSKELILKEAKNYENDMIRFMRDLIAIPGESCKEENVIRRIKTEMEKVGFDEIMIDKMGNIIGRIGDGQTKIMMDAHIDTVGIGDRTAWKIDPYNGEFKDGIIYGRGASDQRAAMVAMVYAGAIIKNLKLKDDYTLYVTGTCQEEDCDGLPLLHMIRDEKKIVPDYVVITEPTNLNVYRGHRGRMEIKVVTKGLSCHGSAPERGVNAVYKMMPIVEGIEKLNDSLAPNKFLGKGTITVSKIECKTPSLCAVPDECTIYIDRRLTAGEDMKLAVSQIQKIVSATAHSKDARVEVLQYEEKSWTGLTVGQEKYYPTWVLPEDHVLTQAMAKSAEIATGHKTKIDKWTFSTNGVASMGRLGIPTIGFGPAHEVYAHSINDQVPVEHIVKAAAVYAMFPEIFTKMLAEEIKAGKDPKKVVMEVEAEAPAEKTVKAKRGPGRPPAKAVAKKKAGRPAKKAGRPAKKAAAKVEKAPKKRGRKPAAEKAVKVSKKIEKQPKTSRTLDDVLKLLNIGVTSEKTAKKAGRKPGPKPAKKAGRPAKKTVAKIAGRRPGRPAKK